MQKKPPILLIAIVLGVIALGGTALLLSRGPAKPIEVAAGTEAAAVPTPTPVPEVRYIANRDIPPRTTITPDMMRRSAVSGPKPVGAISSPDDIRGLITKKTIRSGDTISSDSFIPPIDRIIPANFTIPSGFRAVAIYVDPQQTAAGVVDVGDRIDVIAVNKMSLDVAENQRVVGAKEFSTGRTIGTNLLVLAVDESLYARPVTPTPTPAAPAAPGAPSADLPADAAPPPANDGAAPETRPADGATDKPAGNIRVILAAPLETASRLVTANNLGTLHVLVRNPLDGDEERSPEVMEYPSRAVTFKKPDGVTGGPPPNLPDFGGNSGGNNGPAFPVPDMPDVTVTQTGGKQPSPMPIEMPVPNPGGETGDVSTPKAPEMRDVMVVRGTEKTRVIVPKR